MSSRVFYRFLELIPVRARRGGGVTFNLISRFGPGVHFEKKEGGINALRHKGGVNKGNGTQNSGKP